MKRPKTHTLLIACLVIAGCGVDSEAPTSDAGPESRWAQSGYLKASNPVSGDQLGFSQALSGDGRTLVIGAPMNSSSSTRIGTENPDPDDFSSYSSGAVYVFAETDGAWSQQAFIKASNQSLNDQFGSSVTVSGDGNTLAVASVFEDSAARGIDGSGDDNSLGQSGAVYVYTRNRDIWSQQAYIKASNAGEPADGDSFGYSISLSDDGSTLAVGALSEDSAAVGVDGDESDNTAMASGAVYVFTREGDTWSQQAYVKSSNTTAGTLFGYSVALDAGGNTLAAGSYDEDGGRGAVYIFTRSDQTWSEQTRLQSSNAEGGDSMGSWVAISDDGDTVAGGAADEDSFLTGVNPGDQGGDDQVTNTSAGAVYVFVRNIDAWSQQAYIKASNSGREDWFGVRLALSGDGNTLAAGAPNEDSAGQGIGGIQQDDSADEAGAVYVYTRNGEAWTHQLYVKGSYTEQFDEFGGSVTLNRDGTVMAVGARFEDGSGAGINGNAPDNASPDSGSVYLFTR